MNKVLVSVIKSIANKFGFSISAKWELADIPLELHLKHIFEFIEPGIILDIGANTGQYYDLLKRRVGYLGYVHSFEPQGQLASDLYVRAQKDPFWHIHNCALGSSDGTLELNVMANSDMSSFLEPISTNTDKYLKTNKVVDKEFVQVKKLDDVYGDLKGSDRPLYVKIDTQGFDQEVVAGGELTIAKARAIQFELSLRPIYRGVPDWLDVIKAMTDRGFAVSAMFPISYDEYGRTIELDCVMIATDWKLHC